MRPVGSIGVSSESEEEAAPTPKKAHLQVFYEDASVTTTTHDGGPHTVWGTTVTTTTTWTNRTRLSILAETAEEAAKAKATCLDWV